MSTRRLLLVLSFVVLFLFLFLEDEEEEEEELLELSLFFLSFWVPGLAWEGEHTHEHDKKLTIW